MSRACGYRLPNMTTTEPSISVWRDVDAPTDKVFDYLARPANQAIIDGSGMLRGTAADRVLSRVGETFEMEMHNDRLGDYVVENRVVEYEPSRRLGDVLGHQAAMSRGAGRRLRCEVNRQFGGCQWTGSSNS